MRIRYNTFFFRRFTRWPNILRTEEGVTRPETLMSILRAKQARRTRCSSHPIEATACGIVAGLRGLELQTNAITTPFAPLYADRVPRIYRPVIEIPTPCRSRDIREDLPRSNFLLEFLFLFKLLYRLLIASIIDRF